MRLVKEGRSHATLVYEGETPVGWCQYGPSDEPPRIDAGRNYRRAAPEVSGRLWRTTCFFTDRRHRGRGVSKEALKGALASVARQGGGTVEACPVASPKMAAVPGWRWFGTPGMFEEEGFRRVAKLGTSGVLMRRAVAASGPRPGLGFKPRTQGWRTPGSPNLVGRRNAIAQAWKACFLNRNSGFKSLSRRLTPQPV